LKNFQNKLENEKRFKYLLESKSRTSFVSIVYAEIINLLKTKYDLEKVQYMTRKVGIIIGNFMLKHWIPKQIVSIPQIIKDYYKKAFFSKIRVTTRDNKNYFMENKDCPVCGEGYIEKDVKFCDCIAGITETFINYFHENYPNIPKVKVTTLESKASGDKSCIYYIKVL